MSFVVAVGEVKASNAQSTVDERLKLLNFPAGWSESADDLGLTFAAVRLRGNHREIDVSSSKFGSRSRYIGIGYTHGGTGIR